MQKSLIRNLQLIAILPVFIVFSCSDTEKESNVNASDSVKTEIKATQEIKISEEVVKQSGNENDTATTTGPIKAENIKKGDKIDAFTVSKIEYKPNEIFTLELEGKSAVEGTLSYNEFEESWDITTTEGQVINIDGIDQPFLQYLNLNNMQDLKSALSKEQIQKAQTREPVATKIEIKNPKISVELDKGRFVYYADFISLN